VLPGSDDGSGGCDVPKLAELGCELCLADLAFRESHRRNFPLG